LRAALPQLGRAPERYFESQFKVQDEDASRLTPSHAELVRLPIRELFTTNFHELIELTFKKAGGAEIEVSVTAGEFRARTNRLVETVIVDDRETRSRLAAFQVCGAQCTVPPLLFAITCA
jgi:hypothetical protein